MSAKSVPYLQRGPLQQCMNAIRSPNRTKPKMKKETESTHKRKRYFSPITIPCTPPERRDTDNCSDLHTTSETEEGDHDLYYSIYNRYRPDIDESNAESTVDRLLNVETEYLKLRKQRQKQRNVNNQDSSQSSHCPSINKQGTHDLPLDHHSLSPFQPISGSLTFHSSRKESPIIEPMELTNIAQDIILDNTHFLCKPSPTITTSTRRPDLWYWCCNLHNASPVFLRLEECKGMFTHTHGLFCWNTRISPYHGRIPWHHHLGLRWNKKAIIPECVQVPPGIATTYLLANSTYLLAGYQYVSHLSKTKLKFKGGSTYTMSVTKGHKIIYILPTPADQSRNTPPRHLPSSWWILRPTNLR